ncbi:unnamed protein product [Peniophora sp. CBMAI 1063]|nr:unnamed protein product [Peniophora sp. CBMAI 1063]
MNSPPSRSSRSGKAAWTFIFVLAASIVSLSVFAGLRYDLSRSSDVSFIISPWGIEAPVLPLVLQSSAAHVAGLVWPVEKDVTLLTQRLGGVAITDIQGTSFLSPYAGQTLENIVGTVTAKDKYSFWLMGPASNDTRRSPGIRVYAPGSGALHALQAGDVISLTAHVAEFRSRSKQVNLYSTQLQSPTDLRVHARGNTVEPIVLGLDRSPPTQLLSPLDEGKDGWLSVPNNVSSIDATDDELRPDEFGLDFWESLEGSLVRVRAPVALGFNNRFGDFWVRGAWNVTGLNERGGLSITLGPDGLPDGNPEAVMISRPLDGTRNPKVMIGAVLEEFEGIVDYQHGYFNILPTTTPKVAAKPDLTVPPTTIKALVDDTCAIRFGDYNIENMGPRSHHLPVVAGHIANHLLHPDIMFLQEVQDNSAKKDDGTTSANLTLSRLAKAVYEASGELYNFTNIDPLDKQDGGQPGGNIRTAYLYNPTKVALVPGSPAGMAEDATVPSLVDGKLSLSFNPGRIDPTNDAWFETRKPLVAHWITPEGASFFTINHHGKSKGGSSSTQGDARPPINAGIERRTAQVQVIADFIASILALDPSASIILAGDFNEYTQTHSVVASLEGLMHDADATAGMPESERYTYVFDQNCQQIDHIYVSDAIAGRGVRAEHVHVNNWAESLSARASDHDPSVGMVRVC